MKFLEKIITELLSQNTDLSEFNIVLPGKRPIVFIKRILQEKQYSGFLPNFFTIEDLIKEISGKQLVQGIAMWLFAFEIYRKMHPSEDFGSFLKWFPTILKDWDDMLKFSESDTDILAFMFDEERIKVWSENLSDEEEIPRNRFLNFWKKMNVFLPVLKEELNRKNWASSGMIHENAKKKTEEFAQKSQEKFVFCGFNAFTPTEEKLVKNLLQWDKAQCFFQADRYYMEDERQEAGKFLRKHKEWKEFNDSRFFQWVEDDFSSLKSIKVYEVSGNISQTKVLPEIFKNIPENELSETAVVLLDENLLPASLDAMNAVNHVNITMGFPLKNLSFSNAMKQVFYLQKQLEKKDSSYYYNDVLPIVEELPNHGKDSEIVAAFKAMIEERNIIYIAKKLFEELLGEVSYFSLLIKPKNSTEFLELLIDFCYQLKFSDLNDIEYENIAHFEKTFKIIKNQISTYDFDIKMETLEILINQLINTETIDFQGEPLQGLQVMGLLETRLLNFKNIILLSVNEGKLPLGNSQNTYIPFDVRSHFGLHTFLENDSIYAYHFYRLIQDSENVHLLFNALSSGINTGEKSRFITQIEVESKHTIENIIIENTSEPISKEPVQIEKTPIVLEKLEAWKSRISASHLTSYLYNPVDFYLNQILKTRESDEMEEELSIRNYGNLVHFALQVIYEHLKGKFLTVNDLENSLKEVDHAVNKAIVHLNHEPEFYEKGMNFVHKSIAKRVVQEMLNYDLKLLREGNKLEILELEKNIQDISFDLNDNENVFFYGYIDRIDRLNGVLRIIDYKTGKSNNLALKPKEEKLEDFLKNNEYKQALQLSIYAYAVLATDDYPENELQCGIWSFAEVNKGVQNLEIYGERNLNKSNLKIPMNSVRHIISEILNPDLSFTEEVKVTWE